MAYLRGRKRKATPGPGLEAEEEEVRDTGREKLQKACRELGESYREGMASIQPLAGTPFDVKLVEALAKIEDKLRAVCDAMGEGR